jgi:hypothetical protein
MYIHVGPVYMYSDWATALSVGKFPISGRGKPAESSKNRKSITSYFAPEVYR